MAVSFKGFYNISTFAFTASLGNTFASIVPTSVDVNFDSNSSGNDRIDIVTATPVTREYDTQQRNFRDPISATISLVDVDTKTEYYATLAVVKGTPGVNAVAPATPAGSIKLAEATIANGAGVLSNVQWVTESSEWTTAGSSTVSLLATQNSRGLIRIATAAEVTAGTSRDLAVTPFDLGQVTVQSASQTVEGIIRIATNSEILSTSSEQAVTPRGLHTLTSTQARRGLVRLASNTLVQQGTNTDRAITPSGLASRTATEARTGVIRIATDAEVTAGTATDTAVTPAQLSASGITVSSSKYSSSRYS